MNRIRALAVCVCRQGDRVLVEPGIDRVSGRRFYRAIGGGIAFGERAADAARREWMEEFGVAPVDLRLLGVLENLFTYEGQPGHEIVFVFAGRLPGPRAASDGLDGIGPAEDRHTAEWVALSNLERGPVPLYPEGLLALLRGADA